MHIFRPEPRAFYALEKMWALETEADAKPKPKARVKAMPKPKATPKAAPKTTRVRRAVAKKPA